MQVHCFNSSQNGRMGIGPQNQGIIQITENYRWKYALLNFLYKDPFWSWLCGYGLEGKL